MVLLNLVGYYLIWHYTIAIKDILSVWENFIWFLWNYFSIKQMSRTFFVPWRRLGESSTDIFDTFNYFSGLLITLIMRVVGICIRTLVIALGLFSIIATIFLAILFVAGWLFMPLILIIIFGVGVGLLTKSF